ncbi:DUF1847 domain-containing protein [Chloroflexota bacterium]
MPGYCQANKFLDVIEETKAKYFEPETAKIHLATAKILKKGNYQWPRVRESIELARELGVKKVGLAVCVGLLREGKEFARFLERAGLEVVSVACMIGGLEPKETGVPDEYLYGRMIACNPIAQAEILNHERIELNYIYGLCIGHDTLFIKNSKAPVTCVVAKDVVTANNPSGVLFSGLHRERLWEELAAEQVSQKGSLAE